MYNFIKIQYEMGNLTEEQVRNFAPKWITESEADRIISGDTDE